MGRFRARHAIFHRGFGAPPLAASSVARSAPVDSFLRPALVENPRDRRGSGSRMVFLSSAGKNPAPCRGLREIRARHPRRRRSVALPRRAEEEAMARGVGPGIALACRGRATSARRGRGPGVFRVACYRGGLVGLAPSRSRRRAPGSGVSRWLRMDRGMAGSLKFLIATMLNHVQTVH